MCFPFIHRVHLGPEDHPELQVHLGLLVHQGLWYGTTLNPAYSAQDSVYYTQKPTKAVLDIGILISSETHVKSKINML